MNYEVVIGLEVHIQLSLQSKVFAADDASYGGAPNTHISPLTIGHPGTLPVLNEKAIEYAVMLGLACNCEIPEKTYFARKHYFYPDLPKGFQLTQDRSPVCDKGFIRIENKEGEIKKILLHHIHLEEDAGKSIHDASESTLIDLNRAGVALMEMVTEPCIQSPEDAHAFLAAVRKLVRTINICDGNMEEGSMRCDANISLRKTGDKLLGTKVEVKNLNSLRYLQDALQYEIKRQTDLLDKGEKILQETRSYDSNRKITFSMRDKESAHDYRYFPEPDIPPVSISKEYIERIKQKMPLLPDQVIEMLVNNYGIAKADATAISDQAGMLLFFEAVAVNTKNYSAISNWLLGPVLAYLNESKTEMSSFQMSPESLAGIIDLVSANMVSFSAAAQKLFPLMIDGVETDARQVAEKMNLMMNSDESVLREMVISILGQYPDKVTEYKKGRKGLMGMFIGEVMKKDGGKSNPALLQKIVKQELDKSN